MGLIKKYFRQIITYGLIVMGLLSLVIVIVVHPQRTIIQEPYSFNDKPTLSSISFPFSLEIPVTSPKNDYIELYFGDDSINQYAYTVNVTKNKDILFEHHYVNEQSNIIRLPIDENTFQPNDILTINILCEGACNDVKFKLYSIENKQTPKVAIFSSSTDYRYIWFSIFLIISGITLFQFAKRTIA